MTARIIASLEASQSEKNQRRKKSPMFREIKSLTLSKDVTEKQIDLRIEPDQKEIN